MHRPIRPVVILLAVLALVAGACGGDDGDEVTVERVEAPACGALVENLQSAASRWSNPATSDDLTQVNADLTVATSGVTDECPDDVVTQIEDIACAYWTTVEADDIPAQATIDLEVDSCADSGDGSASSSGNAECDAIIVDFGSQLSAAAYGGQGASASSSFVQTAIADAEAAGCETEIQTAICDAFAGLESAGMGVADIEALPFTC